MNAGNPSWFVSGREPYRGKWRVQPETMSKAAADEYAAELVALGWRDVKAYDLTLLRHDLVTLAAELHPGPRNPPRGNGRLSTAAVTS